MGLRFSDGVDFDTDGQLRIEQRFDGLYVVGQGMLMAVRSRKEGEDFIRNQNKPKVGQRVKTKIEIDRYPHFCLDEIGLEGIVTYVDLSPNGCIEVKLDKTFEDLEEWGNCICWYWTLSGDDIVRDFWDEIELIN